MKRNKKNVVVILAAGLGARFNSDGFLKQMTKLAGKPVLLHTLKIFEKNPDIDEIIIVTKENILNECKKIVIREKIRKVTKIVSGGETRQESSRIGIFCCREDDVKKILIHDAVRPFVSQRIISDVIKALDKFISVDVAVPSPDTLIEINEHSIISNIPRRSNFRRGQTPQGFHLSIIKKAHELAMRDKFNESTDDCGLILHYGLGDIYVVSGEEENIKITYPLDIHIADQLFQMRNVSTDRLALAKKKLKGKNIIIFGHSSGIGRELFKICDKSEANVSGYSLSNGVDICNIDKVKKTFYNFNKKYGKIDFLISTAGILQRKKLEDFSRREVARQIDINYVAQVNLIKYAIDFMAQKSSIALFTSSSYTRGRETYSIYSSTKAAIVNFVQAISEELYSRDISINAICPSRTNTPMRTNNFGKEPKNLLLDPKKVAEETLKTCLSDLTGQIISIRK
ncbi:MAG: bifunctional cytidylyltransferase/SDR family oxidoreductase [Patescibacteria group bacterium]